MAQRHVLVTGGSGFIGSALVRRLVERGDAVRVLDDHSRGAAHRLDDVRARIELVDADVRDAAAVAAACRGIDLVCHLAYVNGTERFYQEPDLVLDVAVKGMIAVVDGAAAHAVPELLLLSSSEVYQTPPHGMIPTPEDVPLVVPSPLNPRYSYGAGKIIAEMMALHQKRNRRRTLIVRPHNVYGPDMGDEHVIPQLVRKAVAALAAAPDATRATIELRGTGEQSRSFIFIDDFVDALELVLAHGADGDIVHVGTSEERTIRDVLTHIGASLGAVLDVRAGPAPAGEAVRRCPDVSKLHALGFLPRVPFADGVARTTQWYRANPSGRRAR